MLCHGGADEAGSAGYQNGHGRGPRAFDSRAIDSRAIDSGVTDSGVTDSAMTASGTTDAVIDEALLTHFPRTIDITQIDHTGLGQGRLDALEIKCPEGVPFRQQ